MKRLNYLATLGFFIPFLVTAVSEEQLTSNTLSTCFHFEENQMESDAIGLCYVITQYLIEAQATQKSGLLISASHTFLKQIAHKPYTPQSFEKAIDSLMIRANLDVTTETKSLSEKIDKVAKHYTKKIPHPYKKIKKNNLLHTIIFSKNCTHLVSASKGILTACLSGAVFLPSSKSSSENNSYWPEVRYKIINALALGSLKEILSTLNDKQKSHDVIQKKKEKKEKTSQAEQKKIDQSFLSTHPFYSLDEIKKTISPEKEPFVNELYAILTHPMTYHSIKGVTALETPDSKELLAAIHATSDAAGQVPVLHVPLLTLLKSKHPIALLEKYITAAQEKAAVQKNKNVVIFFDGINELLNAPIHDSKNMELKTAVKSLLKGHYTNNPYIHLICIFNVEASNELSVMEN